MKKKLSLLLALFIMCSTVTCYAVDGWTDTQNKAHEIASTARSMGLEESNPIIVEASRIWFEEQAKSVALEQEKQQKEKELQNFLNYHYSEAVAMAGTMYAEARGLDKREMSMICWCILNRVDSGRFGNSLSSIIWVKSQFAHSNKRYSDNGTDLVWLAQDVLARWYREKNGETNVGRTLPQGYYFYYGNGKHNLFRKANSGAGSYNFGLWNPYE